MPVFKSMLALCDEDSCFLNKISMSSSIKGM